MSVSPPRLFFTKPPGRGLPAAEPGCREPEVVTALVRRTYSQTSVSVRISRQSIPFFTQSPNRLRFCSAVALTCEAPAGS
jgi:hypothetical protein